MITLSLADIVIILAFFVVSTMIGILGARGTGSKKRDYLLSGGKIGLTLFVMTNVSTWYGGILGVGEYSFRYGLASWFTQGLPYYIFAVAFAFLFTKKIKAKDFYSIPDAISHTYGSRVARTASVLIFFLVSPAPYLLMVAYLLMVIFQIPLYAGLILSFFISAAYLFKGGYKADVLTDAFFFIIMFSGFAVFLFILVSNFGGLDFLMENLPVQHLELTGGMPLPVILVWWFVALWTFADPGFYQRVGGAVSWRVARKGIIISVFFWFIFDILTNGVGLYGRAVMPGLKQPVLTFPLLAEKVLSSGLKGFFIIALLATILSTLNSFLFLSAVTFGNDLFPAKNGSDNEKNTISRVKIGLIVSGVFAIALCLYIPSVIEIWYTVGSICIPGIILLIFSSYFPGFRINKAFAIIELTGATIISLGWHLLRQYGILTAFLNNVEPMITGLIFAVIIHLAGMKQKIRT